MARFGVARKKLTNQLCAEKVRNAVRLGILAFTLAASRTLQANKGETSILARGRQTECPHYLSDYLALFISTMFDSQSARRRNQPCWASGCPLATHR
jgi:hypothetical protein